MFRLFEILSNQKKEILSSEGVYTVHELGQYQIEYQAEYIIDPLIFIEDENINKQYIHESSRTRIVTYPFRFFEDYFGFAKVQINGKVFLLNILGEKFELKEIEQIILYLFERNHTILNQFVSKSSISAAAVYEGKEYMYSSKYLNLVDTYCQVFEDEYSYFVNLSHTVLRKKYKLIDYHSQAADSKSIEWVLQNLDTVSFDPSYSRHPEAVVIAKNYGLIEKIGAEENTTSYKTYENEIILGSFKHLEKKVNEIKHIIKSRLNRSGIKENYESSLYTDFRDLKIIPFLRLLKEIEVLEARVFKITSRYSSLFKGATPINQFPKLTPVFYKYRHYQKAFTYIKLLHKSDYNLQNEIQLLNVRKLSELYELYALNVLIEDFYLLFNNAAFEKEVEVSEDDQTIIKLKFKRFEGDLSISLFYQPNINNTTVGLNLITIGNTKLTDRHCKPDFVLEIVQNGNFRYCILDAKYSKINTVRNTHLTSCIKKYIIDIGIKNEPYKKPDYLILLHPDSEDNEENLIYNNDHYPKIRTIVCKPDFNTTMLALLKVLAEVPN